MKKELIYLASPYSHQDKEMQEERFRIASKVAAILMNKGLLVFSPIAHTHPIAVYGGLPTDFAFWEKYDYAVLSCCAELYVLMIDGWLESIGVQREIEIAKELGLVIRHIDDNGSVRLPPPNSWSEQTHAHYRRRQ